MFSVIIPLYNKENEIGRTLQKLLNQTYQDFEVIIVNDGSTDNSVDIVKKFNDSRIKLYTQNNAGAAAARNKGVTLANNDWIAFLDADDEWKPCYLEVVAKTINAYPECLLVGTNYEISENKKKTVLEYPMIDKECGVLKNYFVSGKIYTPLWTTATVMRKDVFIELGGFPITCKTCEDVDLWCRVALTGDIVYINKPLAIYNRGTTSMLSKTSDTTCYYPFLDTYRKYIDEDNPLYEYVEDYVIYRQLVAVSFNLLYSQNRDMAKVILKKINITKKYRKKYSRLKVLTILPTFLVQGIFGLHRIIKKMERKI